MGEGNLVLLIVVVPNIKPSVLSCQEEGADSRRGETTVAQITFMIFCFDEGSFEIIHPDFGTPVTNRHKYFWILEVSNDSINRAQMPIVVS